ncbi:MAG: ATP synthase subunit a [Candidatus Parcubacteria bacterium]|nr:MAG: ATP synthase subunit a [Candidatus Parcubacteria bacterium]GIW67645.1 MAG: ATP synthase subunit a [Candidatus Parcubacteria bacterium]
MISLKPEVIFENNFLKVTNTLLAGFVAVLILIVFSFILRKNLKEKQPLKIQLLMEIIFEKVYNFWQETTGIKNIKIFAFCFSFFIYILISNWLGIFPGFGSIYLKHHEEKIHLLRTAYSDLNMALALALISVGAINLIALSKKSFHYFRRFLNPIGVLEIISEFSKIISFSFRLFGNIFAGEVLILTISFLMAFLAPLPFLFLEIFVGFVQALIFFALTSVFLRVALSEH